MNKHVPANARPGDFAVVHVLGPLGNYLSYAEWLMGDPKELELRDTWDHALLYVGDGKCIEAMPWGVSVDSMDNPVHLLYSNYLWSTDILHPTDIQREGIVASAYGYVGTFYNYLEWIPALAWIGRPFTYFWYKMLPAIMDSYLLMCSQLVAQSWENGGYPLCGGRWAAYVSPADLGSYLLGE